MKKLTAFLIAAFILMSHFTVYAAPPSVSAPSAILIDAETGRVLYEKNADTKMYPASTTKVMTGLLAAEYKDLEEEVTATNNVLTIEKGSSAIYINPGEILTMRNLLYALMLPSANDAAIVIAEHLGGSIAGFSTLMNEKAQSLGAVNTNFVNPNGLHDDNHYTTARDLSLIAREGMKNPIFREIVGTYHYEIPATNKQVARDYLNNSNKLISPVNKNRYEYAIGIKTGYTSIAQHCLVGGAKKDNMELISVVLGDSKDFMYPDTVAMFEYGFANFKRLELLKKDMIVTTINIENGDRKLNLIATEDYSITGKEEEIEEIQKTKIIKLKEEIQAPVKKGDIIGTVSFTIDGKEQKSIELIAEEDVLSTKLLDKLTEANKTINWWLAALIVVVLFLLWRTIVTYRRMKRRKRGLFLDRRKRY
ncbi:MAG: Serine-type D-Ala-D-Ala carboxypeptidase [Clostridia bacterium]|nr:Serine-type D-Ala-D-Ala carboxypeptidase [Clostridia bacterium]